MADTHVISALVNKRGRLDGEIQMRRYQISRLEMELAHIDAVIRMFKPGYDISKIATKRSVERSQAGTAKGSGTREALTILREAGEPLSCRDIAERILARRKEEPDADTISRLANNIHGSFSRRRDGVLQVDITTQPATWRIANLCNKIAQD